MKTCKTCLTEKSLDEFYKYNDRPGKYHAKCKVCELAHNRNATWRTPEARTRVHLRSRYNIDLEDRDRMLQEQDGCAVCHTWEPSGRGWCIDHDHACCAGNTSCGKCVRGVLCGLCNTMLGHAKDDIDRLLAGAWYLMKTANLQSRQPVG